MTKPHHARPTKEVAHQEDTTAEIDAGASHTAHRRTTVTVEREMLSVLVTRSIAETVETPATPAGNQKTALDKPEENLPGEITKG